jgi:hypothetical protein
MPSPPPPPPHGPPSSMMMPSPLERAAAAASTTSPGCEWDGATENDDGGTSTVAVGAARTNDADIGDGLRNSEEEATNGNRSSKQQQQEDQEAQEVLGVRHDISSSMDGTDHPIVVREVEAGGEKGASEAIRIDPSGQDGDAADGSASADDEENNESDEVESEEDDDDAADGPPVAPPLSLAEIREWKLRRNQAKLVELGLAAAKSPTASRIRFADSRRSGRKRKIRRDQQHQHQFRENDGPPTMVRRGMLLPPVAGLGHPQASGGSDHDPTWQQEERINQLYDKYPHRHRQVRSLLGLLRPMLSSGDTGSSSSSSSNNNNTSVPLPILAVGPSGTGKTSVVRDVLDAVRCSDVGSAYVDCAALDAPNLRAVTRTLLHQLQHHIHASAAIRRPEAFSDKERVSENAGSRSAIETRGKGCECVSTPIE